MGFSNYVVGRSAARYLIGRGFKRIGAIAAIQDEQVGHCRGEERTRGFEEELRFSGIATDPVLGHGRPPVSYSHGATAIAVLLAREPSIEAVFARAHLP